MIWPMNLSVTETFALAEYSVAKSGLTVVVSCVIVGESPQCS